MEPISQVHPLEALLPQTQLERPRQLAKVIHHPAKEVPLLVLMVDHQVLLHLVLKVTRLAPRHLHRVLITPHRAVHPQVVQVSLSPLAMSPSLASVAWLLLKATTSIA